MSNLLKQKNRPSQNSGYSLRKGHGAFTLIELLIVIVINVALNQFRNVAFKQPVRM